MCLFAFELCGPHSEQREPPAARLPRWLPSRSAQRIPHENYVCTAERNYTGYCSPEVDKLVDQQSAESDKEKRKQLVWEIEKRLAQDGARPVIFYPRQATCRHRQG